MGQLIMWNLITLNGYFEGADNWDLAWHEKVWGGELEQFSLEQGRSASGLLFGRVTYQGMAAYWPSATGEVAEFMNRVPKYVFSRTLERTDWNNTRLVKTDAAGEVARLKERTEGDLYVFGSATLSATLAGAGLFDEFRIGVAPLILSAGRPLFGPAFAPLELELIDTRALSTGCVILRYRPANPR